MPYAAERRQEMSNRGDSRKRLDKALAVLSTFDGDPDLVLYYKYLLVLPGDDNYIQHFNETDELSDSQKKFARSLLQLFQNWWEQWPGRNSETA